MQSKQKSRFLVTAVAAALTVAGGIATQAFAEGSSSPAEVQRGVPGVDVDVNSSRTKGVDVDMQAGNKNDSDNGVMNKDKSDKDMSADTRTLGAGSDTTTSGKTGKTMRHDRN